MTEKVAPPSKKEHLKEYQRKWREEHQEQIKESKRKWRINNRERVREASRKWKKLHKKQIIHKYCNKCGKVLGGQSKNLSGLCYVCSKSSKEFKEKKKRSDKKYSKKNKEVIRLHRKLYYLKNKEILIEKSMIYHKINCSYSVEHTNEQSMCPVCNTLGEVVITIRTYDNTGYKDKHVTISHVNKIPHRWCYVSLKNFPEFKHYIDEVK